MACSIKFVLTNDFIADIDALDLMTGGYSLADDGYLPTSAPDGVSSVHEVITLKLQGTSKDNLAALTQDLDEKVKQVGWWLNNPGVERYLVWIRVQLDGETYPRQAQILDILPPDSVRVFTAEEHMNNYIGQYSIAFERTPFWEDPYTYPSTTAKTGINSIGGTVVLSETIYGDVPARLARIDFKSAATIYDHFWIGWRTSRFGTTANFVPVWSLKDGSGGGTDTNTTSDSSAYSGTRLTCTFGSTATLVERCYMTVLQASPTHPADQRGMLTVLLRAKMSDSSVARVRLRGGWFNSEDASMNSPVIRSRQVISGTDWNYYELGTMTLPPFRFFNSIVALNNFTFALDAERISGSGSLHLDCLVMIPSDEGMLRIVGASTIDTFTNLSITAITPPNFEHYGLMIIDALGSVTYDNASISQIGWSLPANAETPRLIGAGSGNSVSAKSTTFDMSYTYIPRWRTLRGNVT